MVRSYLATEEAGKFQLMMQTNDVIEKLMKQGVESGTIVEAPQEQPLVLKFQTYPQVSKCTCC